MIGITVVATLCGVVAGVLFALALQARAYRCADAAPVRPAGELALLPRPPAAADPRVLEVLASAQVEAEAQAWEAVAVVGLVDGCAVFLSARGSASHADARLHHALEMLQRRYLWEA
jgi:hypothetical protein